MSFGINYVAGGRFDPPFMPTKTEPYIKGQMLESIGGGIQRVYFQPEVDVELLAVSVGASEYEARDYWDLIVDGRVVCDTIFTKDLPEGMYFTAIIPVEAGKALEFVFHNEGARPKFVWVNYQMLK
jgi:hypothetical protein